MTTLTLSMIVKAIDQASPTLSVFGRNLRGMTNMLRMFNVAWNRGIPRLGNDVVQAAKPAIAALGAMKGEALGLLKTVSAIALGAGGIGFAFKKMFVERAADAERFRLRLEAVEESPGKAESAAHWIADFKRRTGIELKQIQEAWIEFRRNGLNPISGAFNRIADAAAATGLDFDKVAGLWASAMDGNVKGLDALGITAEKVGDRIIFKYNRLGQTIQKTVDANNKAAIQQALGFIINEKYAGFADRYAKTLPAMWSNLAQSFGDFTLAVMNAGVYDKLKKILSELTTWTEQAGKDGTLKKWKEELAEAFNTVLEFGREVVIFFRVELPKAVAQIIVVKDWLGGWKPILIAIGALMSVGLVTSILKFVAVVWPLVKAIALLSMGFARIAIFMIPMLVQALATVASFITATLIPAVMKLGAAFLATPVGWIVLALASIAVAAYLLYQHWDEVWSFLDTKTGRVVQVLMGVLMPLVIVPMRIIREWEPLKAAFAGLWDDITAGFERAVAWIEAKWEQLMAIARGAKAVLASLNPFGDDKSSPAAPSIAKAAPVLGSAGGSLIGGQLRPQTVDGEIRVVVEAADGTAVRVTGAKASGPVDVAAILGRYGSNL